MPGRGFNIPNDMLPHREHMSDETREWWISEWRRLVWGTPRFLGIYGGVFAGGLGIFALVMPPWEIADTMMIRCGFALGELFVSYCVAKVFAYGLSAPIIRARIEKELADEIRRNA